MKKILTVFILILILQTPSQADDIRDFQIEGMSIGDSLLDYYSQEEINNFQKANYYKDNEFTTIESIKMSDEKNFEYLNFSFKTNDKKYIIVNLAGDIDFVDNIKNCYSKKDEIVKEISELFKNSKKRDLGTSPHEYDKTGNSVVNMFGFYLETGLVNVSCYDWSEKLNAQNYPDTLRVVMMKEEFNTWLAEKAYK